MLIEWLIGYKFEIACTDQIDSQSIHLSKEWKNYWWLLLSLSLAAGGVAVVVGVVVVGGCLHTCAFCHVRGFFRKSFCIRASSVNSWLAEGRALGSPDVNLLTRSNSL